MGTSSGDTGRIAVDAMGGDMGPAEVVEAVKLAFRQYPALNPVTLVGDEAVLRPLVHSAGLSRKHHVTIHHASEVVTMDDKPLMALKRKRDSSMVRAIELVRDGQASVGSHYCRVMLGIPSPRVGLMNIGTEEGKGSALITETNDLLRRIDGLINYSGPIEGFQVFAEHVDVVICDGFVGNIMLKSWESLVKFFSSMLREELQANPMRATGALLAKSAFSALKERINPERYAGAPLLGLKGNILKAHGSSNRRAIKSAIHAASQTIKADMNHRIEADRSEEHTSELQSRQY